MVLVFHKVEFWEDYYLNLWLNLINLKDKKLHQVNLKHCIM
jgi:hypothetical protein